MNNREKDIFVTIGIPFYNAANFLYFAIKSVLKQSHENFELLLLDDGSTDNSMEIAGSFNDSRIKIISDGENKGLIYRLNQLTYLASGAFYARMDADDIMHFNRIASQVHYLYEYPNVDVVGSSYYSIDSNNQIVGRSSAYPSLESVETILKKGCFAHPTIMGRTEWFRKNQYDVLYERMEDFELWIRTVDFSTFMNIQEPLLFYRNVGIPTLQKYLKSNIGIIRLLQNRKKYGISLFNSLYFTILYLIKILIYLIFAGIGKIDYLIKRRTQLISEEERHLTEELLLKSIL